jgi:catechol-2,3-dioxygenase
VRIGHIHLKVSDIDRALTFYSGILGFHVTQRFGKSAVFLSAGGYHHHIGLNTWESRGAKPPAAGTTGLYHAAILYPTRAALADAFRRLIKAGIVLEEVEGALSILAVERALRLVSHEAGDVRAHRLAFTREGELDVGA